MWSHIMERYIIHGIGMCTYYLDWNEVLEFFKPIEIVKWIPTMLIFLRMSSQDFGEVLKTDFELYELHQNL